jgi:hypothetical protein
MLGSLKDLTQGAVALIGGQKAAAAFKAVYETAEGVACLASGTWPPQPEALIAAGLHFESAAEFARLAGASANRHGGGGSSGGGGVMSPGSGWNAIGGPHSQTALPTVNLHIDGTQFASVVVPVISQAVQNGTVRLTASTTVLSTVHAFLQRQLSARY